MPEPIKKIKLDTDTLLVHFSLPRLRGADIIEDWMKADGSLEVEEEKRLGRLHQQMLKSGDGWNEEELKMKFLSHVFDIADIEVDEKIMTFYERPMNDVLAGVKISVICDCLLASPAGIATPRRPYFFLQEFKPQKGDSHDPEAQMLAAMLVASHLNSDDKPVYGAWLVGGTWNFTLLHQNKYHVSSRLDATDLSDLRRIVFILRKLKSYILQRNQ